jgi:hypothetical protein
MGDAVSALKAALVIAVPGSGAFTDLFTALLNLAADRQSQLDRLERKLNDLHEKDFRQGVNSLREALSLPERARLAAEQAAEQFEAAYAT